MGERSLTLKKSLVKDKDSRNRFLTELKDYISQQSHGLRHWAGPNVHTTWGESALNRKIGPNEKGVGDIMISLHTGEGPEGCLLPGLSDQAPLLVVRVKRSVSPKTTNSQLRKTNGPVSYSRRTPREVVDQYDSFYYGGPQFHNRASSTLAELIEPLLQSFADRM